MSDDQILERHPVMLIKGQLRREADDGCVTCGLTIRSALTWAHVHADPRAR